MRLRCIADDHGISKGPNCSDTDSIQGTEKAPWNSVGIQVRAHGGLYGDRK
jgi:hypothetical protein